MSIKDLAKFLGTLSSTALTILPEPLHMRHYLQIHNLFLKRDYNDKIALNPLFKEELNWSMSNLRLQNG